MTEDQEKGIEMYEGPMATYKITGKCSYGDENGVKQGELEIGSIQSLPTIVGDLFVADGLAEIVSEVTFDYDKLRNEETVPAVKEIFRILGDNADLLVFPSTASKDEIVAGTETVCAKIKEVLVSRKVPNADMAFLLRHFDTIPNLFDAILKQKNDTEKTLLMLAIGSKNPGNGEPSLEYSNLYDLFAAFNEATKNLKKE